jgi:acyl-CoA thioesterase FadM
MPEARIRFYYSTFNEQGQLANEAYTELFFMDALRKRPVRAPKMLTNALENFLNS